MHENGRHGSEDTNHDEVNPTQKNSIEKEKTKKTKHIQNRVQQALDLPVLCNINPRSVYNKCDEFSTFVKEEQCDVIFISES